MKFFLKRSALGVVFFLGVGAWAQVPGFDPSPGYWARDLQLTGGVLAISPSGKLAVATDNFTGGASIRIYDRILPEGRTLLHTLSAPNWKFFGGLDWESDSTLVFTENGDLSTALRWDGVTTQLLAPSGSVVAPADIVSLPGQVLVLSAGGPNQNRLVRISGQSATVVSPIWGAGFGGGLAVDGDQIFAGDTNDPTFIGQPGKITPGTATFSGGLVQSVAWQSPWSLAGGGGQGLYSFARDSEGDFLASTGSTLTQLKSGVASNLGMFTGAFPFPTSLDFWGSGFEPGSGSGMLVVNGGFAGTPGLFAVMPVPEPSTLGLLAFGAAALFRRRKRS